MPEAAPEQLVRGIFARLVRGGETSPSSFSINKVLRTEHPNKYTSPSGAVVKKIESELKAGPFPKAGMAEFGFEYWYNYFFKELPDIKKIPFSVHAVNDDGTFRTEASPPPGKSWKTIFDEILAAGFKSFTTADHLTAKEVLAHAAQTADNTLQRDNVQVVFRGDGRVPETIKSQGGTARQSRVEALRSGRNMNKPWHPFNKQGHLVWVRNGFNGDNCLFSTVSITPQFFVATKFPLLDDLRGSNPSALGHSIVLVRPRVGAAPVQRPGPRVAQAYQAAAQASSAAPQAMSLPASRTNIYCIRMRDAYNTQNYQGDDAFPEYATTRISWMDHLVWFEVTRIHFDEMGGNAGHLIVITAHRWLQDKDLIRGVLLNRDGLGKLEKFVSDIATRGALNGGVGGIVYTPPGVEAPPFDIVSVRELFVAGRPQPAIPGAVSPQSPPPRVMAKVNIPAAFRHPT